MVPELENARVTELHVRMDCNGCVHRIKKAISGIDGVYSVNIDFAQQKLTVVGSADPARIVRAIKKTRKIATICSHTEPSGPGGSDPPPTEPAASSGPPATEPANQPPSEAPTEAAPPSEPAKDSPPPDNPEPDIKPSPEAKEAAPEEPKDVAEIHMVHHYPHSYVYRDHWTHNYPPKGHEAPHVTHSYSSYQPSAYVSEYGYHRSPPHDNHYTGAEANSDGYYNSRGGREITSMFSDENPNACRIV